jgi:hypothetical protein
MLVSEKSEREIERERERERERAECNGSRYKYGVRSPFVTVVPRMAGSVRAAGNGFPFWLSGYGVPKLWSTEY